MATDRDTPARSKLRTALRQRSWKRSPGSPVFLQASAHVRLNDFTGCPLRWKTSGMIRVCARSHRRVYSWRRSRSARSAGVIWKARPSPFFVMPGSSRRKPPFQVDLTPREREHLGASPSRLEGEAHAVGDLVPQAPGDRLDLVPVGEALADVVLRKELDPRHRGDHVVVQAEPVRGSQRRELAVDGRGRSLLLEAQGGVAEDVRATHARCGHVAEQPEQLFLAVLQPLETPEPLREAPFPTATRRRPRPMAARRASRQRCSRRSALCCHPAWLPPWGVEPL